MPHARGVGEEGDFLPPFDDKVSGRIHSIETAGAVDGPGIRFVVFVSGCPLRCLYCHNPDTRSLKSGKLVFADELAKDALRYKDFLSKTGGGVTVSGGEPLYQQEFVTAFFKACRAGGLSTALDTSGFLGNKVSDALLAETDLVLLDIKSFRAEAHKALTGIAMDLPLAFARKLARIKKPAWIRFVLVPGLTDDLEMIAEMVDFVASLGNVQRVEVLPFHKMGEEKWAKLGLPYTLSKTEPPSPEQVAAVQALFRARGLIVV